MKLVIKRKNLKATRKKTLKNKDYSRFCTGKNSSEATVGQHLYRIERNRFN